MKVFRDAVNLTVQAGHSKIEIEGDSQIVIQALIGKFQIPWLTPTIIEDICT